MKRYSLAITLSLALAVGSACSKKPDQTAQTQQPAAAEPAKPPAAPPEQTAAAPNGETTPEAANPNDLPATVFLNDGSKYTGVLVAKNGSQLTFRGDNGATRTFDSRDVKSIRFGSGEEPKPSATASSRPKPAAPEPAKTPADTASAPAAAPEPPPAREIVIPAGTQVSVRTNESIDSKTAGPGQTFSAMISKAVVDDSGAVAIPRGSGAALVVKQASAGKVKSNQLVLDLASVTVNGRSYEVDADAVAQKGKDGVGANKRTAKFAGGGAALGAIIGAIAGGGKGAAIGAATGAGAGAGTQIFTRGSVKVPAESILTFRLEAPLRLEAH